MNLLIFVWVYKENTIQKSSSVILLSCSMNKFVYHIYGVNMSRLHFVILLGFQRAWLKRNFLPSFGLENQLVNTFTYGYSFFLSILIIVFSTKIRAIVFVLGTFAFRFLGVCFLAFSCIKPHRLKSIWLFWSKSSFFVKFLAAIFFHSV